jgi:GxxExxY protein
LESAYEICLCEELRSRGLRYRRQVELPLRYKGVTLEAGYRIDVLVEDQLLVEVKAVEALLPVHEAQILTYLRLANLRVGLLLNFHVPILMSDGFRRLVR